MDFLQIEGEKASLSAEQVLAVWQIVENNEKDSGDLAMAATDAAEAKLAAWGDAALTTLQISAMQNEKNYTVFKLHTAALFAAVTVGVLIANPLAQHINEPTWRVGFTADLLMTALLGIAGGASFVEMRNFAVTKARVQQTLMKQQELMRGRRRRK